MLCGRTGNHVATLAALDATNYPVKFSLMTMTLYLCNDCRRLWKWSVYAGTHHLTLLCWNMHRANSDITSDSDVWLKSGLFPGRLVSYEMYPVNDRKSSPLIVRWSHSSWSQFHLSVRELFVCFEMQNDTNNLSVILCAAVVGAEPLVRGLRKLPEDIDWSYSGMYEPFAS